MSELVDLICGVLSDVPWGKGNVATAQAIIAELGLEVEANYAPESVAEFTDTGHPVYDERFINLTQKHHFEWVDKHRYTTPWKEVPGGRRDRYCPGDEAGKPTGTAGPWA